MAPTCTDGLRNGVETGTDCGGGTCPKCATGSGCKVASDCVSGVCATTCSKWQYFCNNNSEQTLTEAPACNDSVKNGNEGDVDCGGGCSTKCTPGQSCNINLDCDSSNCDPVTQKCCKSNNN